MKHPHPICMAGAIFPLVPQHNGMSETILGGRIVAIAGGCLRREDAEPLRAAISRLRGI